MSRTFFQKVSLLGRIYGISGAWHPRLIALSLGLIIVVLLPAPPDCMEGNGYRIIVTYLLARAVYALVVITGSYLFFCPGGGTSFAYREPELGVNLTQAVLMALPQFVVTYNLIAFWLARRCASAGVLYGSSKNNHIGSAG